MSVSTHIPLEGACNVRHLGGYPTRDDGKTRMFALMRGESPARLTDRDVTMLIKLGIRTVIDLREYDEIAREPGPFASVPTISLHSIPLMGFDVSPAAMDQRDMRDVYLHILENRKPAVRQFFQTVLSANCGIFFHCTAGKDRTGVLAALLLLLAGVLPGTVVEEYCYTQTLLAPWLAEQRALHGGEERQYEANPEYIRTVLKRIQEKYHGIAGYLQSAGLSAAELAAVRGRLLEGTGVVRTIGAEKSA